ncbi:MAG TPA: hypothetical protein VJ793_00485 [Anaerolineae bacterium]|nr:hypothetical protein [Anaerolineae bacterium]
MIVLDEEIHGPSIARPIAAWYVGRVVSVTALRPKTLVKDDAISTLLRAASHPTFITINGADFWRRISADLRYCVVCVELPATQMLALPDLLRRFLRLPEFKTKAARMGKVVRLRPNRIEYYEADRHIHTLAWPD